MKRKNGCKILVHVQFLVSWLDIGNCVTFSHYKTDLFLRNLERERNFVKESTTHYLRETIVGILFLFTFSSYTHFTHVTNITWPLRAYTVLM